MGRPDVQVVWFKRDLRIHDHAALTAAVDTGAPVLPLYVVEPSLIAHPHTSPRHVEFAIRLMFKVFDCMMQGTPMQHTCLLQECPCMLPPLALGMATP